MVMTLGAHPRGTRFDPGRLHFCILSGLYDTRDLYLSRETRRLAGRVVRCYARGRRATTRAERDRHGARRKGPPRRAPNATAATRARRDRRRDAPLNATVVFQIHSLGVSSPKTIPRRFIQLSTAVCRNRTLPHHRAPPQLQLFLSLFFEPPQLQLFLSDVQVKANKKLNRLSVRNSLL